MSMPKSVDGDAGKYLSLLGLESGKPVTLVLVDGSRVSGYFDEAVVTRRDSGRITVDAVEMRLFDNRERVIVPWHAVVAIFPQS